jgi:hypothetical protein
LSPIGESEIPKNLTDETSSEGGPVPKTGENETEIGSSRDHAELRGRRERSKAAVRSIRTRSHSPDEEPLATGDDGGSPGVHDVDVRDGLRKTEESRDDVSSRERSLSSVREL